MLEFSDRAKAIRVHRRNKFDKSRVPVATVNKVTFAVVVDNGIHLSEEELKEVQQVVDLMTTAETLQRHLWALELPRVLREAVDFCVSDATDIELRVLTAAVAQAHSRLAQIVTQRRAAQLV